MKNRKVSSDKDAHAIIELATQSAARALEQIGQLSPSMTGLRKFWSMKTERVGCDPLNSDAPLNLIEQLNQTFTYIASAKAAKMLLLRHPKLIPFTLRLGNVRGSDIESMAQGGLAAEVFAAVSTQNNQKLKKDNAKVGARDVQHKYVFFMCPGYEAGRQHRLETRPDVEVWSVGADL